MAQAAIQIPVVLTVAQRATAAADACDVARKEAKAKTSEARAAAASCLAARDNEAAAKRVAQKAAAGVARDTAALKVRDAAAAHRDARAAAEAAALAALQASVLCAEASRQAVAAALEARQPVAANADAAALAAAQAAANLCCVDLGDDATEEDRAAAAGRAVPRANAAGAEARQAADSCDAALADPKADEDRKFLDSMRGWLMTVAALFVNMTFMAIMHPPSWVPDNLGWYTTPTSTKAASGAPSPAPGPGTAVDTHNITVQVLGSIYLLANTATFGTSILLVVLLVNMGKGAAATTLKPISFIMRALAFFVAVSFSTGASSNLQLTGILAGALGLYALTALFNIFVGPRITYKTLRNLVTNAISA